MPCGDVFQSVGLGIHVRKRHPNFICYLDKISDIIETPDYVGINPGEPNSIEMVKCFNDNIQIGIKLDAANNYLYVATLFDVTDSKIEKRIESGRLKRFIHVCECIESEKEGVDKRET